MEKRKYMTVDGIPVEINGEKNLLEVIRKVPIADKVLPFYRAWYESSTCEYLLHTPDQKHFDYRNYYDSYSSR